MTPELAGLVAERVAELSPAPQILWHGGEPLSVGFRQFTTLHQAFAARGLAGRHCIQTNGTMIDDKWCEFFQAHNIRVSVSLDGPEPANAARRDWRGHATFNRALRGLRTLRRYGLPTPVLVTVDTPNLDRAGEIYNFLADEGVAYIGVNIVEQEGAHRDGVSDEAGVRRFWDALWVARAKRRDGPEIREFRVLLDQLRLFENAPNEMASRADVQLIPSIFHDGRIVLLAPELMAAGPGDEDSFVIGHIRDVSLADLRSRAAETAYVRDYLRGLSECRSNCEYWPVCRQTFAGNRHSEAGRLDVSETQSCRNVVKCMTDVVLSRLSAPVGQGSVGDPLWTRVADWNLGFLVDRLVERQIRPNRSDAVRHVVELKRFLYLRASQDRPLAMTSRSIDQVWHELILFTNEYAQMCESLFSRFIHHSPRSAHESCGDEAINAFHSAYLSRFGEIDEIWFQ